MEPLEERECPVCYTEPGTYADSDGTEFFAVHNDLDGTMCDGSDMAVPDGEDED